MEVRQGRQARTNALPRYRRYAKATFRKDRRLNIRLSSKDLEAIQRRACGRRGLVCASHRTASVDQQRHRLRRHRFEQVMVERAARHAGVILS